MKTLCDSNREMTEQKCGTTKKGKQRGLEFPENLVEVDVLQINVEILPTDDMGNKFLNESVSVPASCSLPLLAKIVLR